MDFTQETVKNLRAILDSRKISAEELCSEYLELIKTMNPDLKAFAGVTAEEALSSAKAVQSRINAGEASALTGIPAAVNDNIMTEGLITSCGSKMLADFIPPYDAGVIELLKEAGYVLLGKAAVDEFSTSGSPRSGAAVSVGLAPYSLGTDTGGAIRRAAAFYGLTGLRPTYGRVSRFGLAAFASSLDQIGPIAKTAEDCAIILNAICARDSRDASSFGNPKNEDFTSGINTGVKGLKIAVPKEFFGDNVSEDVKTAVIESAKILEKQGAELIDISVEMTRYAAQAFCIISSAEASSNLSRYDGVNFGLRGEGATYAEQIEDSRNKGFGSEVKRRIMFGNFVLSQGNYDDYFQKARALRQKIRAEYDEIFKSADIILTPTVSNAYEVNTPARRVIADFCTASASLAELPCVSTTCAYKTNGLPVGMSLTGRKYGEATILQAADFFERTFNPENFS
ncbi:MAG: aspartyl/glutamyl-tRNA amidotransferase subunit A [Oscillospiraceae bacterium]|jgi:aspartyl-tRNA(Asn)/glutamyl-tRNA(Gln) amidotransferase subunit A|nr:aspartyl/glutamyl-tRNA amidotransferase subunit A [Oscillospiraceae bacterium]